MLRSFLFQLACTLPKFSSSQLLSKFSNWSGGYSCSFWPSSYGVAAYLAGRFLIYIFFNIYTSPLYYTRNFSSCQILDSPSSQLARPSLPSSPAPPSFYQLHGKFFQLAGRPDPAPSSYGPAPLAQLPAPNAAYWRPVVYKVGGAAGKIWQ